MELIECKWICEALKFGIGSFFEQNVLQGGDVHFQKGVITFLHLQIIQYNTNTSLVGENKLGEDEHMLAVVMIIGGNLNKNLVPDLQGASKSPDWRVRWWNRRLIDTEIQS